jgi:hypothetical protein
MNHTEMPIIFGLKAKHLSDGEETYNLEVYVCDHTKADEEVQDYKTWVSLISRAVCEIAGGCQVIPGEGLWIREIDGELMHDRLTVIKANVSREKLLGVVKRLRHILYQYGKECEQEYVAFSLNGELYVIDPTEPY